MAEAFNANQNALFPFPFTETPHEFTDAALKYITEINYINRLCSFKSDFGRMNEAQRLWEFIVVDSHRCRHTHTHNWYKQIAVFIDRLSSKHRQDDRKSHEKCMSNDGSTYIERMSVIIDHCQEFNIGLRRRSKYDEIGWFLESHRCKLYLNLLQRRFAIEVFQLLSRSCSHKYSPSSNRLTYNSLHDSLVPPYRRTASYLLIESIVFIYFQTTLPKHFSVITHTKKRTQFSCSNQLRFRLLFLSSPEQFCIQSEAKNAITAIICVHCLFANSLYAVVLSLIACFPWGRVAILG